jgi:uncharacterized membrane protein
MTSDLAKRIKRMRTTEVKFGPLLASGTCTGLGLGGLIDTIIFRQILQTHNILSTKVIPNSIENLKINIYWDGIFQSFFGFMILSGIIGLWRAGLNPHAPKSTKAFSGSLLVGWGLYNVLEGFLFHEVFKLHHVWETESYSHELFFDLLFIGSGILLILIGKTLIATGKKIFLNNKVHESRWKEIQFKPAYVLKKS